MELQRNEFEYNDQHGGKVLFTLGPMRYARMRIASTEKHNKTSFRLYVGFVRIYAIPLLRPSRLFIRPLYFVLAFHVVFVIFCYKIFFGRKAFRLNNMVKIDNIALVLVLLVIYLWVCITVWIFFSFYLRFWVIHEDSLKWTLEWRNVGEICA